MHAQGKVHVDKEIVFLQEIPTEKFYLEWIELGMKLWRHATPFS